MKRDLNEVCANCGETYGYHQGDACPDDFTRGGFSADSKFKAKTKPKESMERELYEALLKLDSIVIWVDDDERDIVFNAKKVLKKYEDSLK